jgi:hypothetical protein
MRREHNTWRRIRLALYKTHNLERASRTPNLVSKRRTHQTRRAPTTCTHAMDARAHPHARERAPKEPRAPAPRASAQGGSRRERAPDVLSAAGALRRPCPALDTPCAGTLPAPGHALCWICPARAPGLDLREVRRVVAVLLSVVRGAADGGGVAAGGAGVGPVGQMCPIGACVGDGARHALRHASAGCALIARASAHLRRKNPEGVGCRIS